MEKNIDSYQVWTAIVTPMESDDSVDYESLEKLLRWQDEVGNAVTILGSTGEALNIDMSERKAILDFAIGLNLSIPLMVGVGGINLRDQKQWIEYLNKIEVDAYLLVVPLYAKPGIHGQYGWFKQLLDTAKRPCMLYNVPGRTAKKLENEAVKMLIEHKNFWAIKEASGSEVEFRKYKSDAKDIKLFSGDDAMLPIFSKLGASGVVSVASNVWPEATKKYAAQCIEGKFTDENIWSPAIEALFSASNPIPVKALMAKKGIIKTAELRLPLSSKDLESDELLARSDKAISEWLATQG